MQAARVGLDPWRVLAPGGRVEKLVERALIDEVDAARTEETAALVRGAAVTAGQVVALCLGVNPAWVGRIGEALLTEGGADAQR